MTVKIKHYWTHENKANRNKVLSYCEAALNTIKNNEKVVLNYAKLPNHYHFKLDFQKVDQHTGGKWLIHDTKHRKDNLLKSLESPGRIF